MIPFAGAEARFEFDTNTFTEYKGKLFVLILGSVSDRGCLSRIRIFPSFRIHDHKVTGSRIIKLPDPGSGSATKNLIIFNPKSGS